MAEKAGDGTLLAMLAACPRPGATYRHCKTGGAYVVVGSAIEEATREPLVLYQRVGDVTLTFARPLAEWDEQIDAAGRRRFSPEAPR